VSTTGETSPPPEVAPTQEEILRFTDRALDRMSAIVTELGDDLANRTPDLPGANSPYQILTHCLGVCEYWGGAYIRGREYHRDRESEFTAAGEVAALAALVEAAKEQLRADLAQPRTDQLGPEDWYTLGGAVMHLAEEMFQHLGHLEVTRDLILNA
jgi:hypothetical protein